MCWYDWLTKAASETALTKMNIWAFVLFFVSLLHPLNLQGAFWGLVIGLLVGCTRMLLDFIYPAPLCYEDDDRPSVLKNVHYLYFSTMLSFLTLVVVVVISLATDEPKPEQVSSKSELVLGLIYLFFFFFLHSYYKVKQYFWLDISVCLSQFYWRLN